MPLPAPGASRLARLWTATSLSRQAAVSAANALEAAMYETQSSEFHLMPDLRYFLETFGPEVVATLRWAVDEEDEPCGACPMETIATVEPTPEQARSDAAKVAPPALATVTRLRPPK